MTCQLVVLRHGHSLANQSGLIASSVENAGDAFGLTTEGRAQVRSSVAQARAHVTEPISVLSSPLLRARETAEIAADLFGTALRVDDRLIERDFGDLEMGPDDLYESVWAIDRKDPTHRTWRVESVVEVLARLQQLLEEIRCTTSGTALLVTHGDVASALICASVGVPLSRHREVGGLATAEILPVDWPTPAVALPSPARSSDLPPMQASDA